MLALTLALIKPLLPLVAVAGLHHGGLLNDFQAHLVALLYVVWLLIRETPSAYRVVPTISLPLMVLYYLGLPDSVGFGLGIGWLTVWTFVVVLVGAKN